MGRTPISSNELVPSSSDKVMPDTYNLDSSPPYIPPIHHLPVELLLDIFTICAQEPEDDQLSPLVLSHVCQSWREIVYGSPAVWQYISLTDRRGIPASAHQVELWLAQSQSLPLHVRVHITDLDLVLPLLLPLLPHIHRWQTCVLTGKIKEETNLDRYSAGGSKARFDDLQLTIRGAPEMQDAEADDSPRWRTFYFPPAYIGPQMHKVTLHLSVLSLPIAPTMTTFNLRNLNITESSMEVIPDPLRLLEFLEFCPMVETFHYFGFPHEPNHSDSLARPKVVVLYRLRVLVIRSTCAVRIVLSHIDAPNLCELYLEHTNMEFDPGTVAPYPYDVEDGDSDDEAGDFSQSPWSDHATGMGLRSLIRRSNPPLEVLAMDYADMRTKDFLWCFDRLRWLQDFRIVASDMSDKVIGMLAPFRDDEHDSSESSDDYSALATADGGEHDLSPHSNGGTGTEELELVGKLGPLSVRMPRLTVLELWNCQRLSGDAVVHALGSRARYTDRIADDEHLWKLADVAVIQCVDFRPRHVINLSPILGTRLRIS